MLSLSFNPTTEQVLEASKYSVNYLRSPKQKSKRSLEYTSELIFKILEDKTNKYGKHNIEGFAKICEMRRLKDEVKYTVGITHNVEEAGSCKGIIHENLLPRDDKQEQEGRLEFEEFIQYYYKDMVKDVVIEEGVAIDKMLYAITRGYIDNISHLSEYSQNKLKQFILGVIEFDNWFNYIDRLLPQERVIL